MTDDIDFPEDTRKSRLDRTPKVDADAEIVRASDRFKAFRRKHKDGYVTAELERVIEHPDGHLTYIVFAKAWVFRPGSMSIGRADATAWAQGSTKDPNPIIAGAPLESADTIARSRALRNLGILPEPRRT